MKILGKTRDSQWLLVENDNGRWVKAAAIEPLDSLALVPVKEPTPTVAPPTNTPLPQPSPSPSPKPSATVSANAPDFAPTNASLIDGGTRLRVTIANLSTNSYDGPLVVSVGGVGAGTLTQSFGVRIPANSATTVDFDLTPAVTTQKSAQVKVDPENAIKETNEDNNSATFVLSAPVEQPDIVITSVDVSGTSVIVSIKNSGGPLAASDVTVKVTIGQSGAEQTKNVALTKDNPPVTFTIPKPGSGTGKVEVLIKGVVVASAPLIVSDSRIDPRFTGHSAVRNFNLIAYAGVPLVTAEGHTLGTFCVIDGQPHAWTDDDISTLTDLAAAVMTEIELRQRVLQLEKAQARLDEARSLAEQRYERYLKERSQEEEQR